MSLGSGCMVRGPETLPHRMSWLKMAEDCIKWEIDTLPILSIENRGLLEMASNTHKTADKAAIFLWPGRNETKYSFLPRVLLFWREKAFIRGYKRLSVRKQ